LLSPIFILDMGEVANIVWDTNSEIWDVTAYIWGIWEVLVKSGGPAELTDLQRQQFKSLKQSDKERLITLYVEVYKDYLDPEARLLAERANIKLTSVSRKEINEKIDVKVIENSLQKIVEVRAGNVEIVTRPKLSITALFEILDIKG
jgi:hypothetical protein